MTGALLIISAGIIILREKQNTNASKTSLTEDVS
jgi:hypothetical protein